jgi:hypothetical protein
MYKTGGLEITDDESVKMSVEGVDYIVSDKFKTMLRDSFIDWGTFLEIYHDNMNDSTMFEQIVKLLNIKDNGNLIDIMLPLIKKIYELPAKSHMASMLKQFMIYEPVSISMYALFTTIKNHYEDLVKRYLVARNRYIIDNSLDDPLNDIEELIKYWNDLNDQYNLESSSVVLLFINPPSGLESKLHISIKSVPETGNLLNAIRKYRYAGFCPKVPHERLKSLLTFPIKEIVATIKKLDKGAIFPNYEKLEKMFADRLKSAPDKPVVPDEYKRQVPPTNIDKLDLVKWYVDEILNLRKSLLKYGKDFENYYIAHARLLNELADMAKKELN